MKSIKELVMKSDKTVYIHTPAKQIAKEFLKQAEQKGFVFADGKRPTRKKTDDFFALHKDLTMNYIGFVGRIAWQTDAPNILKLEYESFDRKIGKE